MGHPVETHIQHDQGFEDEVNLRHKCGRSESATGKNDDGQVAEVQQHFNSVLDFHLTAMP
jgi:hypothetical protein